MTTEPERLATKQMQDETAHTRSTGPGDRGDAAHDAAMVPGDKRRSGTHVLPMPADGESVAGMPREQRLHTEPGDPGAVAPEGQVVKPNEAKHDRR